MPRDAREAGIYVHFPYCLRKCLYCDFASVATRAGSISQRRYTRAVLREAELRARAMPGRLRITSIYVGGGTPSLWDPSEVEELVEGLGRTFEADPVAVEVTLECNPSSLDAAKACAYREAGVNRLSVGVQSTRDTNLRLLGRLHDAAGGLSAVRAALESGVRRVSADVILALPGQGSEDSVRDALAVAGTGVGHMSAYLLSIELGTRLDEERTAGRLVEADEGSAADAYLGVSDALTDEGWEHYEVSSYAKPGQRSVHNLAVWRGGMYVGLGAGAVGLVQRQAGDLTRYRNVASPERYLEAVGAAEALDRADDGGVAESVELVDRETRMTELIMSGLRVAEGVDLDELGEELGVTGWTARRERACARLQERGRVVREGGRVRIPRRAWLWESDTVARLM